jgi:hypothetical protein
MEINEHLKFSLRGFSPKRMGYLLDLVSMGFVPVHMHVSCEQSGGIAAFAFFDMLTVLAFCLFTPRSTPRRFGPFALGLAVLVLHNLFAH